MSEWTVGAISVELERKRADLNVSKPGGPVVIVRQLPYDEPGEQTEAELRRLVLKAARDTLDDLLKNPPE